MASSFVLLLRRSIEVGEKLGAGGSIMLSHIPLLFFNHLSLLSFCSILLLPHLLSLSFDTITCFINLLMQIGPMRTSWRRVCFVTSKDVQQVVRNSQADCLDSSVGVVTDSTVRGHSARRDHRGKEGDAGDEKLLKSDKTDRKSSSVKVPIYQHIIIIN